jgi:hypothetical protein
MVNVAKQWASDRTSMEWGVAIDCSTWGECFIPTHSLNVGERASLDTAMGSYFPDLETLLLEMQHLSNIVESFTKGDYQTLDGEKIIVDVNSPTWLFGQRPFST